LIQSDDEQVVALAGQVAVDEKDASAVARALERHVYELIDKKDFSTALGSAAEVARSRRGDCTEHAVLLAALARARGLASRVVVGLVYVPSLGGFGYHMWTELWLQDHWLALDATRAGGGTGGGHIKIAHASLSDADGLMVFLPVLKVIGQMQLEVLEEVHD
jgi:transglutaminase-like putative cysteine protease